MRHATSSLTRFIVAVTLVLAGSAQAFGQEHPFGLDPYKPSDAFWLRNFGGVLVAETPIVELAKLDPYKPSEAALIRQVGAAMPVCCPDWWGPGLAPHTTFVRR